jgi:hypothetical protein
MPTQKATRRNKKANRGNIKSPSSKIDQILLQHLLSPHRFKGFSYLAKNERIPPQESTLRVKNRLQYLKRIQDQDASEFLHLCSSNNVDASEFCSQPKKLEFEDSDDSNDASESDDSSEEEDSSNTTTLLTPTIRTKDLISMTNNIPSKKYLVSYPDGRYLGVVKLESGFNENREAFRMSECRRKVIHRKKKATDTTLDPMEDANNILNRHGFDENSIHRVTLQAKIDEMMQALKTDEYTDTTIFEIDEECKAKFVDEKGSETNKVYLGEDDADGTMWVYFWLMGKHVKPENLSDATLQRDKKRSKADRALQEMHSQFSEQMQQAQQEKANMAKQMAQMQAQLAHLLNNTSSSDAPMPDPAASSEYSDEEY